MTCVKPLGQLEAAVMQRLWDAEAPVSVRDVLEDLQRERPLAYTTVMTVLDHLHDKGLVTRSKQGRAFLYSPTMTREAHTAGLLDDVLSTSADRSATLLHFVGQLDESEVADLRAALDASTRTQEP
ncbi:BlaI/MecI/CopY family transcriptional regulator [Nocardioides caricicola]|uniref:BlaI/MecI/CopY family transcriptional regulator n=1 Tax=Nocardioides caricicola TaxID=634770 RepID=A0ABW0N6F3_9ACTN